MGSPKIEGSNQGYFRFNNLEDDDKKKEETKAKIKQGLDNLKPVVSTQLKIGSLILISKIVAVVKTALKIALASRYPEKTAEIDSSLNAGSLVVEHAAQLASGPCIDASVEESSEQSKKLVDPATECSFTVLKYFKWLNLKL